MGFFLACFFMSRYKKAFQKKGLNLYGNTEK